MKRTVWRGKSVIACIIIVLVGVALAGGCIDNDVATTTSETPTKETTTATTPTSPETTAPTTSTPTTIPPTTETIVTYSVDISVFPGGAGMVTPSGGVYDDGAEITLSAVPVEGYVFDHWGGDVEGESSVLDLVVNSPMDVRAIFVQIPPEFILLAHDSNRDANNWLIISGQAKNEGYSAIERAGIDIKWYDAEGNKLWQEAQYYYDVQPGQIIDFEFTSEISDEDLELLPKDMRQSILLQHKQAASYEITAHIVD